MAELSSSGELRISVIHEFYGHSKVKEVSNNSMAYGNRTSSRNVLGVCYYDDDTPENLKKARDAVYACTDIITEAQKDSEDSKERAYGNYGMCDSGLFPHLLINSSVEGDGVDTVDRSAKLFGDNYPRLQELKRKYDPNMLFSKWFPIKPASS